MNFVADESVDHQIVSHLREEGHAVWYIVDTGPGASDSDVLELARRKGTILLTADKDFGEMVFRQRQVTEGVIHTPGRPVSKEESGDSGLRREKAW